MSAKPPTPLIRINIDRMTEGLLGEFEALIADWDRTDYDTVDLLKQIRENLKGNSAKGTQFTVSAQSSFYRVYNQDFNGDPKQVEGSPCFRL